MFPDPSAIRPSTSHRIIPLEFAATAEAGEYQFEYSDAGFCNGGRHDGISRWRHGHAFALTVRGENLEAYLRGEHPELMSRVRFVKVDAEGADLDVLRSIARLLEESRPFIRAEVFGLSPVEQRRALVDFLRGLRYDLHRLRSEAHYRGAPVQDMDVEGGEQFDLFATPTDVT
jgi:FkbM family methyltransferase